MKSAQANVDRLKALTEYKRIVAPFDGIVTVRNTDVGALINTGSATGTEMFVVADIHKLRLYVSRRRPEWRSWLTTRSSGRSKASGIR